MRVVPFFALGFVLIIVGIIIVVAASLGSQGASTGIVVFIGPVPIVFGSGNNGSILALIGVVIALVMILSLYLPFLVRRRARAERENEESSGSVGSSATYK